jgi:hypothetical protein
VKLLEELGLPELTDEQVEQLCLTAEEAARIYVYSKIPPKKLEALNVAVEVEGTKPVKLSIDIDIILSKSANGFDVQSITDESVKRAFTSAEKFLEGLTCHSQK